MILHYCQTASKNANILLKNQIQILPEHPLLTGNFRYKSIEKSLHIRSTSNIRTLVLAHILRTHLIRVIVFNLRHYLIAAVILMLSKITAYLNFPNHHHHHQRLVWRLLKWTKKPPRPCCGRVCVMNRACDRGSAVCCGRVCVMN